MADTQLYKLNIQIEDRASSVAKKIQDGLDGIGQKAVQAAGGVAKIGEEVRQASAVAPRFNSLGMSLQQVVREIPAFTYSATTGLMAVSNNLPILADNIAAARRENAALVASGEKASPVWKQLVSSLFSWQTALVGGITVLTMFGPQIVEHTKRLLSMSDSYDETRKSMEALAGVSKSYYGGLLEETAKLDHIYEAIRNTSEGTAAREAAIRKLNDTYKDYLPYMVSEQASLSELNGMYNLLNTAIRDHIALKSRNAEIDKITEESVKEQSDAIQKIQEALSEQGVSTPLSDNIISSMVADAPKWKSAGDSLREAFLQSLKNIQSDFGIGISRDAQRGIYDYIRSFYAMDTAIDAVNKRMDLLVGKNDQIKELPTLTVTPEVKGGTGEGLNRNLATLGGITNKINTLREAQSKASGQQQIDLEKEIRLWQEKLNLMELAIAKGAAWNLADNKYKDTVSSSVTGLPVPKKISIPVEFDNNTLQRSWRIMQVQFSDSIKEIEVTGQQIGSILTGSIQQFASGLGEALVSGNGLEIFKSMLTGLMDMLSQFGAALIAAGTATLAFKSMFANPIAAIITGTALVAATAAAKAALQNATAFANGGIVSGPTLALVGEYSGARNNPEVIAPLNKLKSMIEPASFSLDRLYLETKVRGRDLYIALQGVEHRNNRTR